MVKTNQKWKGYSEDQDWEINSWNTSSNTYCLLQYLPTIVIQLDFVLTLEDFPPVQKEDYISALGLKWNIEALLQCTRRKIELVQEATFA